MRRPPPEQICSESHPNECSLVSATSTDTTANEKLHEVGSQRYPSSLGSGSGRAASSSRAVRRGSSDSYEARTPMLDVAGRGASLRR
jgi:hypothetical protein